MNWYWHVRIYNKAGGYWHGQVKTGRNLQEIDAIQDFYATLTGCKMLLEGMSEARCRNLADISDAFSGLWSEAAALSPHDAKGGAA